MERIAFISGNTFLYWNSVILALAGAVAVCIFLWAYLGRNGKAAAGFAVLPLALVLGEMGVISIQAVADVLSLVLAIPVYRIVLKRITQAEQKLQ